ncbi:hypothetical protein AB9T88_05650 [Flavobacterium sp. LBUM151]
MIKKNITKVAIVLFLWGMLFQAISWFYPDYKRYYLYLFMIVMIPYLIVNLIKERKEDKLNNTKVFQATIFGMLFIASILIVFFFITKQNYI